MYSTPSSAGARPSSRASNKSLVEVDIGKLENYLLSIKEQLSRHEDELHSPVWWSAFKTEIDQVSVISKKVEHQQIDINSLRDLLASEAETMRWSNDATGAAGGGADSGSTVASPPRKGSSFQGYQSHSPSGSHSNINENNTSRYASAKGGFGASKSKSSEVERERKQLLLEADVEATKLIVRRLETQRAAEHNVFTQIRELQRNMRNVSALIDERAPPESLTAISGLVSTLQTIQPQFNSILTQQEKSIKNDVYSRFNSVAEEISQAVYSENRGKERECVYKSDYNVAMMKTNKIIDGVAQELEDIRSQSSAKDFVAGKRTVNEVIKKRLTVRQRDLLTRWKLFTLEERKIAQAKAGQRLHAFLDVFKSGLDRVGVKVCFDAWCKRNAMQALWELYRIRVSKMISYWISRVKPDLKLWLLRWRSKTVLLRSRIELEPTGAETDGGGTGGGVTGMDKKVEGEEVEKPPLKDRLGVARQQLTDLSEHDLPSKVQVLKESIDHVCDDYTVSQQWIKEHKASYSRTQMTVESNKASLSLKIESQCQGIMRNVSLHANSTVKSLATINLDMENMSNRSSNEFARIDEDNEAQDKKIRKLNEVTTDHTHKLERIFLLQGEMLTRLETLETNWGSAFSKLENCIINSKCASSESAEAMITTKGLTAKVEESLLFYDEEFKTLKNTTKIASRLLEETSYKHVDIVTKLARLEESVTHRLDDAQDLFEGVKSVTATPAELADLCKEFEAVVRVFVSLYLSVCVCAWVGVNRGCRLSILPHLTPPPPLSFSFTPTSTRTGCNELWSWCGGQGCHRPRTCAPAPGSVCHAPCAADE